MNFIKIFTRYTLRNKVFSIITISSLAISISVILLLSAFLVSELKYDKHIEDIDNIFRIGNSMKSAQVPEDAKNKILEQLPEVEAATNYIIHPDPVVFNGQAFNTRIIHTDEDFFELFNIKFLSGNHKGIFNNQNSAIITESLSKQLFGNENPNRKNYKYIS
jgi:putative ABC transport system permease protein